MYKQKTFSLPEELIAEIQELAETYGSQAKVIALGVAALKKTGLTGFVYPSVIGDEELKRVMRNLDAKPEVIHPDGTEEWKVQLRQHEEREAQRRASEGDSRPLAREREGKRPIPKPSGGKK